MFSTRLPLALLPLCIAIGASWTCAAVAQQSSDIAQALANADAPLPAGCSAASLGCASGCGCQPGCAGGPGSGCSCGCGRDCGCDSGCGAGCSAACGSMSNCACDPSYGCDPMCYGYASDCDRWYVSISGAVEYQERIHEVDDRWTFIKFDDGFQANAAIGYSFDCFRLEAETTFMNNDVERAGFLGAASDSTGNVDLRAFMCNIYYDFHFHNCCWEPYIGAGVGVYQMDINGLYPRFFNSFGEPFEGNPVNATSDMPLAYQLRVGVTRPVGRRTELFSGYRYFKGDELTFSAAPFASLGRTLHLEGAEVHALELGLRVRF